MFPNGQACLLSTPALPLLPTPHPQPHPHTLVHTSPNLPTQSPEATPREIKAAYYSVMRDCHPDRSMGDESTEFCMMLNDIYDTLMDPERRAL